MQALEFFKTLADDTRLKCLLLILQQQPLCVCDLTSALQLSQPKISRHLAILREQQLLISQRQGQWIYYQLNPDLPEWAKDILLTAYNSQPSFIQHEQQRLQQRLQENTEARCS